MGNHAKEKKRVLVVDDEPKVLKFVEIYLRLNGFTAILATSGEEAIELIYSQKPHIILLDIVMPGMDGLEVLRQLRDFSSMPVIAFSASSVNHDDALRLGANDFMAKPFNLDEMIDKIKVLLNP